MGREAETSLQQKGIFDGSFAFNFADFYSRHNKGDIPNVKARYGSSVKSKSKEVRILKPWPQNPDPKCGRNISMSKAHWALCTDLHPHCAKTSEPQRESWTQAGQGESTVSWEGGRDEEDVCCQSPENSHAQRMVWLRPAVCDLQGS